MNRRRLLLNLSLVLVAVVAGIALYYRYRVPPEIAFGKLALQTPAGQPQSLNQYAGKVVVLNFWASWCADCLREMPSMAYAQQQLAADNVEFVCITDETPEKLDLFLSRNQYPFTFYRSLTAHKSNGIHALPCTYVIDRSGKVAYSVMGSTAWDDPEQVKRIRALTR
ncbi:MAG: TlpA family protein disulfide reductase [Bacteroidia bacterium]|jgi:thiol-disulfide isomerase/thioredoxin|nr:TlpA family protein disulfide reductase [Bacteroidia bacterium]